MALNSTRVEKVIVGVQAILKYVLPASSLQVVYPHLLRPVHSIAPLLEDNLDVVEVGSSVSRSCKNCDFFNDRHIIPFPLIDLHNSRRRKSRWYELLICPEEILASTKACTVKIQRAHNLVSQFLHWVLCGISTAGQPSSTSNSLG